MSDIIELGAAPAEEDCAQLGRTPDFDVVNAYEVFAHKLAIIARYGQPPAGCRLTPLVNRHDFGVYRTLSHRIDDEAEEAVQTYAEAVENGLSRWLDGGFAPPISYEGSVATILRPDVTELVIGALQTTRPGPDGSFPVAEFETLHTNLATAFPDEAAIARARLTAA